MHTDIKNLTIETFSYCNAECIICPNSKLNYQRKVHLMSLYDFEYIIRLFPKLNEVTLCGCYEPLADSRLPEIFDIIRKVNSNMNVRIFSNGSLLNKWEEFLLNNENLSSIIFSVHGFSPKIYNELMKNLDRDKIYNNIIHFIEKRQLMKKTKLKVEISFIRTSLNIHELNIFKEFWKRHLIDNVYNYELMNWNGTLKNYHNLVDAPKLFSRPCPMYENPLVIDAFGNVVRCCYNFNFTYGNVKNDGLTNYFTKKRISNTYPDIDCITCDGWKI